MNFGTGTGQHRYDDHASQSRRIRWFVYRVEPSTVVALGTSEPFGATKFQL